ncbi:recombinase family protein [[Eubacterium] hominis]|uniref:recombinase family protein n=1 Tax=[Eubacterium] hominis TaxID=2764325 RepID=UPI003A4E2BE7
MEYFYALTDQNNDIIRMCEEKLKLEKQQVYIDHEESEEWKELMATIKEFDKLYVPSFSMFSPDEEELKIRLSELKELRAKLYLMEENQDIDIDVLLDMLDYVENAKKRRLAVKQREGIQKALEKKQQGEGAYGRPKLNLPEDFEEVQKMIMRKEMNHESYRAKIGMKRSTYYKYVKMIRDQWKEEEIDKANKAGS